MRHSKYSSPIPSSRSAESFYFDRYTQIIQGADLFGDIATLRRQLVIFGSLSDQTITWIAAFEASGFKNF